MFLRTDPLACGVLSDGGAVGSQAESSVCPTVDTSFDVVQKLAQLRMECRSRDCPKVNGLPSVATSLQDAANGHYLSLSVAGTVCDRELNKGQCGFPAEKVAAEGVSRSPLTGVPFAPFSAVSIDGNGVDSNSSTDLVTGISSLLSRENGTAGQLCIADSNDSKQQMNDAVEFASREAQLKDSCMGRPIWNGVEVRASQGLLDVIKSEEYKQTNRDSMLIANNPNGNLIEPSMNGGYGWDMLNSENREKVTSTSQTCNELANQVLYSSVANPTLFPEVSTATMSVAKGWSPWSVAEPGNGTLNVTGRNTGICAPDRAFLCTAKQEHLLNYALDEPYTKDAFSAGNDRGNWNVACRIDSGPTGASYSAMDVCGRTTDVGDGWAPHSRIAATDGGLWSGTRPSPVQWERLVSSSGPPGLMVTAPLAATAPRSGHGMVLRNARPFSDVGVLPQCRSTGEAGIEKCTMQMVGNQDLAASPCNGSQCDMSRFQAASMGPATNDASYPSSLFKVHVSVGCGQSISGNCTNKSRSLGSHQNEKSHADCAKFEHFSRLWPQERGTQDSRNGNTASYGLVRLDSAAALNGNPSEAVRDSSPAQNGRAITVGLDYGQQLAAVKAKIMNQLTGNLCHPWQPTGPKDDTVVTAPPPFAREMDCGHVHSCSHNVGNDSMTPSRGTTDSVANLSTAFSFGSATEVLGMVSSGIPRGACLRPFTNLPSDTSTCTVASIGYSFSSTASVPSLQASTISNSNNGLSAECNQMPKLAEHNVGQSQGQVQPPDIATPQHPSRHVPQCEPQGSTVVHVPPLNAMPHNLYKGGFNYGNAMMVPPPPLPRVPPPIFPPQYFPPVGAPPSITNADSMNGSVPAGFMVPGVSGHSTGLAHAPLGNGGQSPGFPLFAAPVHRVATSRGVSTSTGAGLASGAVRGSHHGMVSVAATTGVSLWARPNGHQGLRAGYAIAPGISRLGQQHMSLPLAVSVQNNIRWRRPPNPNADNQLHLRLEECTWQYRHLERERKKTEAELAKRHLGKRISSANQLPIPRLPLNPSRLDRLLVDYFREHARVITLMEKMEQLQGKPLAVGFHTSLNSFKESLKAVQHARALERSGRTTDDNSGESYLANSLTPLPRAVRRARSFLYAALLLTTTVAGES
jgi:hypothetical protein